MPKTALQLLQELNEDINAAELEAHEVLIQEELARSEPDRARGRLRTYIEQVVAGDVAETPDEIARLKREIRDADERLVEDGGQKIDPALRAKHAAIIRQRVEPAQQAVHAFAREHREEIARELMAQSEAAHEHLREKAREFADAVVAHEQAASAWSPFLQVWSHSGGVYDLAGDWTGDMPARASSRFASTDFARGIHVPAPISLAQGRPNSYGIHPDALRSTDPDTVDRGTIAAGTAEFAARLKPVQERAARARGRGR